MPELPEVETVRRGLQPVIEGAHILRLEVRRANLRFAFPDKFSQRVEGCKIVSISRRAKYLLAELDSGEVLVMHLGMSGSFRIEMDNCGPTSAETNLRQAPGVFHHDKTKLAAHDHVVFHISGRKGDVRIVYNDPRRFGFMALIEQSKLNEHAFFKDLGIEPLGNTLNAEIIAELFHNSRAPLKAALLNQRLIAGLGNIYVCEALHGAGLSPKRPAGSLVKNSGKPGIHCKPLVSEIRDVLAKAIEAGGSSLKDHRQTDGALGYFQHHFKVYDREGQKCPKQNCDGTIRRIAQSGRSSFYCPSCQR